MIRTINPATNQIITEYNEMSVVELQNIIQAMTAVQLEWASQSFARRAKCMQQMAKLLLDRQQQYAKLMAAEMGKPLTAGIAEIEKCAKICRYYAKHAASFLQSKSVQTEHQKSYICYQPLGIIFAIMPWNFPMWQVFRFAVPNLMAGNACLLKHAPITTGTALEIEKLLVAAGFPKDLFRALLIDNEQAAVIIGDKRIKGITLTGSEQAGKIVAAAAGRAIKKSVLELGGSDPYIILPDADLKQAARLCVTSRMNNTGQVCIAAKRIIVVGDIDQQFIRLILDELKHIVIGEPLDHTTTMGPMAREDLRDTLHQQVLTSVAQGAELLCGGKMPVGEGFYYPPTVLLNVLPDMPAYKEELFGPVMVIFKAKDETEAIKIANDTDFGLGAAIFTTDNAKGEKIAREQLVAGTCHVNTMVTSDPRLPFGGIKQSGYGRELSSQGIHEFVNIKTIVVN